MNDLAEQIEDEVYEDEENVLSEAGDEEAEELQLDDDSEPSDEPSEPVEAEAEDSEESETDDDGLVVSIDGESPSPKQPAADWIRDLRKQNREHKRRVRELEAKLQEKNAKTDEKPVLGKRPDLADFDYDTDAYGKALEEWFVKKRDVEAYEETAKRKEQELYRQYEDKLEVYKERKAKLKAKDFEDCEEIVTEILDLTQQNAIVMHSSQPELVVFALGKNPEKARELAKINDPVGFGYAIGQLENKLKIATKRSAPPPEKTVKGTGRVSGSVDSTLERLRAEAEKTGDYSKVMRYKKQLKANK